MAVLTLGAVRGSYVLVGRIRLCGRCEFRICLTCWGVAYDIGGMYLHPVRRPFPFPVSQGIAPQRDHVT